MYKEVIVREGLAICVDKSIPPLNVGSEYFSKGVEYKFQELAYETKLGDERISFRCFKLVPNEDFPGCQEYCHPNDFHRGFIVKG